MRRAGQIRQAGPAEGRLALPKPAPDAERTP